MKTGFQWGILVVCFAFPVAVWGQESKEVALPLRVAGHLRKLDMHEQKTIEEAKKKIEEKRRAVAAFLMQEAKNLTKQGELETASRIKAIAEDLNKPIEVRIEDGALSKSEAALRDDGF